MKRSCFIHHQDQNHSFWHGRWPILYVDIYDKSFVTASRFFFQCPLVLNNLLCISIQTIGRVEIRSCLANNNRMHKSSRFSVLFPLFIFFCLMLSDPVDSAPEPFTAPTTCSRCYRANNKTTRERERGSGGNRGDTSTHHHERAAGILKRPTGRLVNRIRTNWASTASTHKTQFYANEYEERKEKTQRHAQSWSVPCWLWPFLPFIYSRWPINTRLHRVRVSSVSIHYSRRKFSLIFCCCCYFAHSDGRHVTCGTAETSGIAQVGKEFTTADVVEQHVEKGLVVMSPHPGQQKRER